MTRPSGVYSETIHWATARDGFESVITIFNYLGFAFPDCSATETDAEILVRFFDEDGQALTPYHGVLATGRSLHLPVGTIHRDFQGMIAVCMSPKGRMPRLSWSEDKPHRPIATSYFMLYQRTGGFRDVSHELFNIGSEPDTNPAEWATVLLLGNALSPAIIVMNNRPYGKGKAYASAVEITLYDLANHALAAPYSVDIPPGGSKLVFCADVFPAFAEIALNEVIATVTGRNIEQPLSLHMHPSGDFNIHHF